MRLSPQPLVFGRFASVWPVSRSFCKRLLEPGSHAFTRGFLFLRFRCVFVPSSHDRQFRVSTCIYTTMAIVYRSLNCEPRTWLDRCYRTSNGCVNRKTLFPWHPPITNFMLAAICLISAVQVRLSFFCPAPCLYTAA